MKITWLGHACFKIESNGSSVVIDPYDHNKLPGYPKLEAEADRVLVTHEHDDHNFRQAVTLTGKKCELQVSELACFHDDQQGAMLGPNTIFIIEDGQFRLAHFGDLGHPLNEEQLKAIGKLDAAIVNVGGFVSSEAAFATELMKAVRPTWIIPCHFKGDTFGVPSAGTLDEFLGLQGQNAYPVDGCCMELKKDEGTHTVVFRDFYCD